MGRAAHESAIDVVLPVGSITDVAGIQVGHHQRIGRGWQTGTTVVHAPGGATPGVSVRGGGPGTRETDALRPENLVQTIHAICLTGGSAFGLAAADGVVAWLEERSLGFPVGDPDDPEGVVPVVPAAVIFDLGRAGRFDRRPTADFGRRAIAASRVRQRSWGAVGAGAGARAGGLQGGVGTASTTIDIGRPEDPAFIRWVRSQWSTPTAPRSIRQPRCRGSVTDSSCERHQCGIELGWGGD